MKFLVTLLLFLSFPLSGDDKKSEILQEIKAIQKEVEAAHEAFFKIDYVRAKKAIRIFNTLPDGEEKISLANVLTLINVKLSSGTKSDFTATELKTIKRATDYLKLAQQEVEKFEIRLSDEEIAFITQDNPASLSRTTKSFFLGSAGPVCSQEEFDALLRKTSLAELVEKGDAIMILAGAYEYRFTHQYIDRILTLLKRPKYNDNARLLQTYAVMKENFPKEESPRVAEYEKRLGMPTEKISLYVTRMASLSPRCLASLNIPFVKRRKEALTRERGRFLLDGLKTQIANNEKRPEDVEGVPVQTDHPVYGSARDAYGNAYVVKYSKTAATLTSLGPDGEPGLDDMKIGSIPLK